MRLTVRTMFRSVGWARILMQGISAHWKEFLSVDSSFWIGKLTNLAKKMANQSGLLVIQVVCESWCQKGYLVAHISPTLTQFLLK